MESSQLQSKRLCPWPCHPRVVGSFATMGHSCNIQHKVKNEIKNKTTSVSFHWQIQCLQTYWKAKCVDLWVQAARNFMFRNFDAYERYENDKIILKNNNDMTTKSLFKINILLQTVSVHCWQEGFIGKYILRGDFSGDFASWVPRDFPSYWNQYFPDNDERIVKVIHLVNMVVNVILHIL